ncbi:MAG: spermidine synthase [Actinobacteria bacterium]|nr:spermidine synthase [Actinomycetota bacterium]
MLFVELSLIRWTAANDVHLAYLTNFVLLSSFLGIGLGFLRARREPDLFPWTPVALALGVGFVLLFPVSVQLETGRLTGAFGWTAAPRWVELSATFALTVAVMAGIGQAVGRQFVQFPPLEAYRLDILGSIAGILVFTALSFLELPPIAWGAVASALLLVLVGRRWQVGALVAVLALLSLESARSNEHWSPYYKITATYTPGPVVVGHTRTSRTLSISANNIPHQTAFPVATLRKIERFYFFPYRHVARTPRSMLIVGAGNGNDVAVALSKGVRHVDAVEIDPEIQALGKRYHPNHPYASPRVSVHIDDGRAFVQNTGNRYDLIVFALPDSLTLLAGQGSLRLENYLFTTESMERVKSLLRPGGVFAMYNYYESWLRDRYAGTLNAVFGKPPCVEVGDPLAGRRQAVLTESLGPIRDCRTPWKPVAVSRPTDDYPFPYLQTRTIPSIYWHTLLLMLGATVLLIGAAGGGRSGISEMRRYVDLACMGAAFLLLETKNVVQFALLFGTTWLVNALVFLGVLLSVWLAVETARRVRLPSPWLLYGFLLAALAVAWSVPEDTLLSLSPLPRFLAAAALAFAPIYLANLVFAQRFGAVGSATAAFAANLLGAMVGGALEYLSLVTGYRALLLVVGGLYVAALVSYRLLTRTAGAPVPVVDSPGSG